MYVNPVNDNPTAVEDPQDMGIETGEDKSTTFSTSVILANDYDVDNGDTFSVTSVSGTSAAGALVVLDNVTH
ncbi:cadherin-like domain-containing protein [Thermodesulfobacteriota bacterium]